MDFVGTDFIGPLASVVLIVLGLLFLPNKKPGVYYTRYGQRMGSVGWFIGVIVALVLIISVTWDIVKG
jgi:hypothetical protein